MKGLLTKKGVHLIVIKSDTPLERVLKRRQNDVSDAAAKSCRQSESNGFHSIRAWTSTKCVVIIDSVKKMQPAYTSVHY